MRYEKDLSREKALGHIVMLNRLRARENEREVVRTGALLPKLSQVRSWEPSTASFHLM